ncbi:hypothetical protein QCD60_30085 [Pokkaliibacter sp. MBI-7]|uniref:hypothetical protein n=1 Tax=Pokkaliibacter sp. MBI-7 TaxID=3040600 RepID=UPI00244C7452|nr:hypothetical protein [Pokkaliibacter sp. MBI-7]MDH2436766.1 hypothetical protein [Pokkaliibacter sp. MBI-7]
MKGVLVGALVAVASLWFFFGPDSSVSYVEIEFLAPVGATPIRTVSITSGKDKSALTDIEPGETRTTRIYPADGTDNQIGLQILMSPLPPEHWEGWMGQRYYPPGTAFRTHIQIDQEGKVISEKSCQLPCSFD